MVFTVAVPGLAINEAEMLAVTAVTLLLTSSVTVVVHAAVAAPALELAGQVLLFHCTRVFATKPLPLRVMVRPGQVWADVDVHVEAGI